MAPNNKFKFIYQNSFRNERIFFDGEEWEVDLKIVRTLSRKLFEDRVKVMVGQAADLGTFVAVAPEADEGRPFSGGQWVLSGFGELEIGINRDENRVKLKKID